MEQTAILMRKNENVFADLSARFHRPWQLYNGIMIAMEYRVVDRLLFGSDSSFFPRGWNREVFDAQVATLEEIGVTSEDAARIFGGNLERLLV